MAQHRCALGQEQRGQEVAYLASTQWLDFLVIRGTFNAVVPRTVVRLAVAVVLTVSGVVLLVGRERDVVHARSPGWW